MRRRCQYTQPMLAQEVGISQGLMCKIELGDIGMDFITAMRLSKALACPVMAFWPFVPIG